MKEKTILNSKDKLGLLKTKVEYWKLKQKETIEDRIDLITEFAKKGQWEKNGLHKMFNFCFPNGAIVSQHEYSGENVILKISAVPDIDEATRQFSLSDLIKKEDNYLEKRNKLLFDVLALVLEQFIFNIQENE